MSKQCCFIIYLCLCIALCCTHLTMGTLENTGHLMPLIKIKHFLKKLFLGKFQPKRFTACAWSSHYSRANTNSLAKTGLFNLHFDQQTNQQVKKNQFRCRATSITERKLKLCEQPSFSTVLRNLEHNFYQGSFMRE